MEACDQVDDVGLEIKKKTHKVWGSILIVELLFVIWEGMFRLYIKLFKTTIYLSFTWCYRPEARIRGRVASGWPMPDLHLRHESKLPVCRTWGLNQGHQDLRCHVLEQCTYQSQHRGY